MNIFDRLRVLLGIGDRRIGPKLGLPPDRRQGPQDRRDEERSRAEASGELDRLAHERWKGEKLEGGERGGPQGSGRS